MKLGLEGRGSSVFVKLLLAFLIVLGPLYTMSLNINILGRKNVQEEILAGMGGQVEYYLNVLEMEMREIVDLQREYVNDQDLMDFSLKSPIMSDFNKTKTILSIEKRLDLMKAFNDYVAAVTVYIPGLEKKLSTEETISSMSQDEYGLLQDFNGAVHKYPLIYWNDHFFINVPYPNNQIFKGSTHPLFDVKVEISKSELKRQLGQFVEYEKGGAALIHLQDNWSMSGKDDRFMLETLSSFLSEKIDKKVNSGTDTVWYNKEKYLVAFKTSDYLGAALILYFPENKVLGKLKGYQVRFWLLSFLGGMIVLSFAYIMKRLISSPLSEMTRAFRKVEKGALDTRILHDRKDEFGYLYDCFNNMVQKLKDSIEQVYEEKIRGQQAELKQLQYQINPHFLYNSLFMIHRMAKVEDYENISQMANHLARYYQFITRGEISQISLPEEVAHARNYVEIQSMRFRERIHVEFGEPPERLKYLMVPRLILQPVIENAYEHGLKNVVGGGELRVCFQEDTHHLKIMVEDNGIIEEEKLLALQQSLKSDTLSQEKGTGLINVHRRLQIRFGEGSGITAAKSQWGGLKIEIRISLDKYHL